MKKIYYLTIAITLLFVSCLEKQEEGTMCTMEFRSVSVQFKDATGNYITVQDYKAIVQRTGNQLHSNSDAQQNQYLVATDSDLTKLSKQGDIILVSAKHPVSGVAINAQFVVKGGECHIEKVSGPQELTFN